MALNVLNKVEINVGFNIVVYLYCNLSLYLFNFNSTKHLLFHLFNQFIDI